MIKLENIDVLIRNYLLPFSFKVIGAILVWILGSFAIRIAQRFLRGALNRRLVDATLVNYAQATSNFVLKAFLILAILGIFGIETTSFSALLAATGVAIGMAWSGLLSNFAAGIFLIMLRPFKVGDTISAAGITGLVREIGLFATSIDNADHLRVFVGNNKIFSDNILNFSTNPFRMLSFKVQLSFQANPVQAMDLFIAKLSQLERLKAPITGEIAEFNPLGVIILMKSACHHSDHAQLTSAGNQIIYETLKAEKLPTPEAAAYLAIR